MLFENLKLSQNKKLPKNKTYVKDAKIAFCSDNDMGMKKIERLEVLFPLKSNQ